MAKDPMLGQPYEPAQEASASDDAACWPTEKLNVLVVGKGIVGDATGYALEQRGHTVAYHDPPKGIAWEGDPGEVDCVLICVPTPMAENGSCDLTQLTRATYWLADQDFTGYAGIRSTVPPGTCTQLQRAYADVHWFSWPEFLQGRRARELACNPHRIVFGAKGIGQDDGVPRKLLGLPKPLSSPTLFCTPTEAEFVKYATNAIHATNVGLANELAELGARLGLAWNGLLPPLAPGSEYLPNNICVTAEGGFGGACLPKDVAALLYEATGRGIELPVLRAVHEENLRRRPEEYEGLGA